MSIAGPAKPARRPPAMVAAALVATTLLCVSFGEAQQTGQEPQRTHRPSIRPTQLSPRIGPPGTEVTVTASLLPAITPVQLALGATRSGFEGLALVLTDPNGALAETVTVPLWARRDQTHRFILFNLYFTTVYAESGIFHVTDADGRVVREGRIESAGPGCPTLRGDDGEIYRLAGATEGLRMGEQASLEGYLSESKEGCGQDLSLDLRLVSVGRSPQVRERTGRDPSPHVTLRPQG